MKPTRMVKLAPNFKAKKITIFEPEILEVLDPNFSYMDYVDDVIALNKGIYQGNFADLENVKLEELLTKDDLLKLTLDDNTRLMFDKLDKSYRHDINALQNIFEESLKQNYDIHFLNEIITKKMKNLASGYLQAFEIVKSFNTKAPKRLEKGSLIIKQEEIKRQQDFKKGLIDWKDMPIEEIIWSMMSADKKLVYYRVRSLPNTPEDYKKYTIRQLLDINKEYIAKKEGGMKF